MMGVILTPTSATPILPEFEKHPIFADFGRKKHPIPFESEIADYEVPYPGSLNPLTAAPFYNHNAFFVVMNDRVSFGGKRELLHQTQVIFYVTF